MCSGTGAYAGRLAVVDGSRLRGGRNQATGAQLTAIVSRWLHIYLSMVSFAVVFFFAATGLTLNHAEWFSQHEQTTRYQGTIPASLIHGHGDQQPDKLGIVEFLRNTHKIHGAVSDFRVEDSQISVSFKGPGYAADGFIDSTSGHYDLIETSNGFIAVINDLHKGRDTGKVWSGVIDVSATLLVLVSSSGLCSSGSFTNVVLRDLSSLSLPGFFAGCSIESSSHNERSAI